MVCYLQIVQFNEVEFMDDFSLYGLRLSIVAKKSWPDLVSQIFFYVS